MLLDPYGGPHFGRVVRAQRPLLESQWFADQGFAVLVIDGRGTPYRGVSWEQSVHRSYLDHALEDQVDGLHAAAERYPFLDLSRVAIRGWSYGGYLDAGRAAAPARRVPRRHLGRPGHRHAPVRHALHGAIPRHARHGRRGVRERRPDPRCAEPARRAAADPRPGRRQRVRGALPAHVEGAHGSRPPPRVHPAERHHAPARPTRLPPRRCCRSRSTSCGGRSGSRGSRAPPDRLGSDAAATGATRMPIIVQKYGGTSVGSVERIQAVADRVVRAREDGNDVVVVVSAMGHTTDELLAMANEIATVPDPRELDMLLTAGERIAMSLLGIAINARGCRAASYTGSQAGIMTDTQHGSARIVEIRPKRILEALGVRQRRGARRLPGTEHEPVRDHDARARWIGPHGGGDGGGDRGRRLRDLHRRGGRLHDRPAHRAAGSQARRGELRRDAGDGRRRRERAAVAVGRVRAANRRAAARAVLVRGRAGHLGPGSGGTDGRRADLRGRARHRRGEGHARARARPSRRRGHGLQGDRRRCDLDRHDRAERVARGRHRPLVHRAAGRPSPRRTA